MAQIDIKEATVKIFDGTLGTLTSDSVAADSDLVWTAATRHVGTDKISITMVDPGSASAALGVVVTGHDIVINLATSTASAITSTAADVKTAVDALPAAAALVTVALETAGAGVVDAKAKATLDGQKVVTLKLGEGNLTFSEKRPVEFTRDRGSLDTVREADEEPMDLSFDALWEEYTASTGSGTPTPIDAIKQIGEAAAWVSTADDQCQPYCVDIELHNAPNNCVATDDELMIFEEFYYEDIGGDFRGGSFAVSGRCNRKVPTARRVLAADIA